jgi:hypothetical protein
MNSLFEKGACCRQNIHFKKALNRPTSVHQLAFLPIRCLLTLCFKLNKASNNLMMYYREMEDGVLALQD